MADKHKGPSFDKLKEGVSVQEIENFARKYTTEAFLILAIIIATISSMFGFFTGPGWSLVFAGLGAILSIGLPVKIIKFQKHIFKLLSKQEKTAQIIIGIVELVIGLFLPFVLFAEMGLLMGMAFHPLSGQKQEKAPHEESSSEEGEEEHL